MTDALPTQIGKYRISELVGEGAMGTVYRAIDSVLGRTVAIKVMNASIARQQDHRQRFLREAQAAGSLQHPNVVTIYDLGELDGHLFIAMEFVHGTDLEKLMIGAEPLKLQSKLDIIVDVLMGLSYAHKHGIIHRDIKPANIRVAEDGHAKIMDFGVAHLAESDMTRTGLVVGTPSYMAPEQVMGGKAVPGTDLFAVGAVLYHLLTGAKPFEGPTLQSLFYKIVTDMPRPLDEVRPGLPPKLNTIVQKAMAKDAAQRYQSALEMANDIIAVRAELSGNSYASTASLTASAVGVVENFAPKPVPVAAPARFGWKPVAGVAAAAGFLFVGWLAFAKPRGEAPASPASASADTTGAMTASLNTPQVETAGVPVTTEAPAKPASEVVTLPPQPARAETKKSERSSVETKAKKKETPKPLPKPTAPQRTSVATSTTTKQPASPQNQPSISLPQAPVVVAPIQSTPPRVVASAPPSPPVKQVDTPATLRPSPREEISAAVQAYARAIESRDIGEVRRAYPGITSDQARGFQQFFQSARDINVTFRIANLDTSGSTADAQLVGTYEYVTSEGKTEKRPVSFSASLRNDGAGWRLNSVR